MSLGVSTPASAFAFTHSFASTSADNLHNRHATQMYIRRRRGAMHSSRGKKRLQIDGMVSPLMAIADNESNALPPITTQYTIDDSICPPTDPETLRKVVRKHITTMPRYWKSKPIANHTAEAFEDALSFVLRYGQQRTAEDDSSQRIKVILDSGCGTGRSSFLFGERYPDCVVIGIE